jgi:hypothetical protein
MKTTLKKLSICPCGFPVLNESIPLGTEYDVEPGDIIHVTFIFGGCHTEYHDVEAIWVNDRGTSKSGYLPKEIFKPLNPPPSIQAGVENAAPGET